MLFIHFCSFYFKEVWFYLSGTVSPRERAVKGVLLQMGVVEIY